MELDFDVVELEEPDHPTEGERAPDFERPLVNDEYWEDTSLSGLTEEGPVVLIFHPMDGAFPATYIWNEIRDRGFADRDVSVVGLSISTPYEHKTLLEEREIEDTGFRLFSDPSNEVAERYGIVNDLDGMTGISEPRPATFVIDEDQTVQYAWAAEEHPAFPDYDELEAAVDAL
ncbi:redoxin domain-containing protein [Halovenus sp. WSH3]|uniref:Redoxin domain-containing protein n=1 Tax=Halovenus carboxidivorans TaxID=2692199 RepID=A0A6B0SYC9_9EURY|nr:redoxin domain-containing protein [Halovenus carboxidivorans]MXR50365.1 redoxin domain-containing protein [Halovenus carboxidivorans]